MDEEQKYKLTESAKLVRLLSLSLEKYSEDYMNPQILIYDEERPNVFLDDYRKTLVGFCNVFQIKLLERNMLPELARRKFDEESSAMNLPIGLTAGTRENIGALELSDFYVFPNQSQTNL